MLTQSFRILCCILFLNSSLFAQENALAKINTEGFQNSQVFQLVEELSDSYGPRLTGTRQYYSAAQWAKIKLESWGLNKVELEPYCDDCLGWDLKSFNIEVTDPSYIKIEAYPYAWTKDSQGAQETEIIFIENVNDLEQVKKNWGGKLKGKTVLLGKNIPKLKGSTSGNNIMLDPLSSRHSEEELTEAEGSLVPNPDNPLGPSMGNVSLPQMLAFMDKFLASERPLFEFLEKEGTLAALGTTNLHPGILHPSGTYNNREGQKQGIPYFAISVDDFGRISRMIKKGTTPKVKFHLDSELYLEPENNVNIIGEITGSDPKLKNEIVMIGAHFDTWHASSGATDNGAGSAVMMEVMRILKASGVKPKRTIRIGLWGGEEQGYIGSLAYAENHFGKVADDKFKKESEQVSVYLNMDNGAGMMKGIYLQGNEAVRPVFKELLKPYARLGVDHLTIQNTNFTDHDVFNHYNIPAFQIIQDPLNYQSVTHHTNMDVLEYVPEKDLMVNATVLAGLVYQIAQRPEKLPRKR
ncbi:M20/M25/M40 family metallo-hydrolase [Lutimonas halocynthiae]|uniref:M20/M25/M40 family metallo-hydrolase n=1 Tax=Lutimonas halocynthiae TaxID=1446477 RepID=UPI0025B389D8|nr:M20/M25/M40 family metallo-hydrolase [Lutimonas halocynthiae]MDN3641174.1 M20/M25/M40 family metallo-hydrolase [Lutimonas halocynthiae]